MSAPAMSRRGCVLLIVTFDAETDTARTASAQNLHWAVLRTMMRPRRVIVMVYLLASTR